MFLCVMSNQGTSKKTHVSDLSKIDILLHKTHIKALRLDMCTFISLSKIAHQMWRDHPFSQINQTTERAVGWGLEATEKGGRKLDKI